MRKDAKFREPLLNYLVISIGKKFRTFGGGRGGDGMNPMAEALKDNPLQFAAGVDVREVVEFILKEIN